MSNLARALGYLAIALLMIGLVVGMYYLAEHLSYAIWYEDMVRQTVQEMVREEALRE